MPKYKNIKIREETYNRLKKKGNMGESFNDLLNRLLDELEQE